MHSDVQLVNDMRTVDSQRVVSNINDGDMTWVKRPSLEYIYQHALETSDPQTCHRVQTKSSLQ